MCHSFTLAASLLWALAAGAQTPTQGRGVPKDGYPDWHERTVHVLANRVRADPTAEQKACSNNTPQKPLGWSYPLNRAARFHSQNLRQTGKFSHDSPCTLVSNISEIFPPNGTCDGSAACACVGGKAECSPGCTSPWSRMGSFGQSGSGENIAYGYGSPEYVMSGWMNSSGHCSNILGGHSALGVGHSQSYWTQNFGYGVLDGPLIAGTHQPMASTGEVEFRVNYYDPNGAPKISGLNFDGTCVPMTRERGTDTNGTWLAKATVGSGCRRYTFVFEDAQGQVVVLPEQGSYGVGDDPQTCPDWSPTTPPTACLIPPNTAPVWTQALPSTLEVTDTAVSLAVMAGDDGGEPALTYTWSATGPAPVVFSANANNAAKSTVATFMVPGVYALTVIVSDAPGLSITATSSVEVIATAVTVVVLPEVAATTPGGTVAFSASAQDQFGAVVPEGATWTVSGGGTIDPQGRFTSGGEIGGPFVVTASFGEAMGSAQLYVTEEGTPESIPEAPIESGDPHDPGPVVGSFGCSSAGANGLLWAVFTLLPAWRLIRLRDRLAVTSRRKG